MLYRHVFGKISTEFRGILLVFVNFAALRQREIPEALTTSCIIYTNWRLKIYIWRLHFSSWSPKGDLRIFLISSPEITVYSSLLASVQERHHRAFSTFWFNKEVMMIRAKLLVVEK